MSLFFPCWFRIGYEPLIDRERGLVFLYKHTQTALCWALIFCCYNQFSSLYLHFGVSGTRGRKQKTRRREGTTLLISLLSDVCLCVVFAAPLSAAAGQQTWLRQLLKRAAKHQRGGHYREITRVLSFSLTHWLLIAIISSSLTMLKNQWIWWNISSFH